MSADHRDLRPFSELTVIEKLRLTSRGVRGLWPDEDAFIDRALKLFPGSVELGPEEPGEGGEAA